MREQLVISQFPEGFRSAPKCFPIRNRTMALLSEATVIVEAGETSGTLHQGWEALRLGRPLFLVEELVLSQGHTWAKEMMGYGAVPLSLSKLDDLLDALPTRARGERSELTL